MNHGEDLKKFSLKTRLKMPCSLKFLIQSILIFIPWLNEWALDGSLSTLSVKLKDIVNYYAELDIQNAEANGEE